MSNPSRKTMEISLGLMFLATLAVLAYLALRMGSLAGFGDVVVVQVRFADASGLVEDSAVKVAGVDIGKVKVLKVDFNSAVAHLQLRSDAQIRSDAIASIRARSLLGEKYVEIEPQSKTAPLLISGDIVTAAPAGIEIEQLASELGPLLDQLNLEQMAHSAQNVLTMLEKQDEPLDEIVARVNRILKEVESLPLDDPKMHEDVRVALSSLRQTSETLPELVAKVDQTLTRGDKLLADLEPAVQRVNEGMESVPQLIAEADEALQRINNLIEILEPQAKRLQDIDYAMIRHTFREEGLLIRMVPQNVTNFDIGLDATPYPLSPLARPNE